MKARLLLGLLGIVLVVACGKKGGGSSDPVPEKPKHGAPVAFIAKSFKPGKDRGGSVSVKGYNFSDKTVAQYHLLFRYYDASGAVLKAKAGTPFESDHDFMSLSGNKYKCAPKSWCSMEVDMLDVPEKTAKVEVLAKSIGALKDDGMHFEEPALFEYPGMDWPGEGKPAEKPAEPAGSAAPAGSAEGSAAPAGSAGSAAP